LPAIFWLTLLLGAVLSIALSVFFFTETPQAHGLMAVAAAVVICASLWLIMALDYPLSGDLSLRPEAFEQALNNISMLQSGHL
jgi:hypothetical protein